MKTTITIKPYRDNTVKGSTKDMWTLRVIVCGQEIVAKHVVGYSQAVKVGLNLAEEWKPAELRGPIS